MWSLPLLYRVSEDCMPHPPIGVFDAGTGGNLDAEKVACRKRAAIKRAKLARATPDAAISLACHANDLVARFGCGIYAGYMPIRTELSPLVLLENLVGFGCGVALPITPREGQPLRFHRWQIGGLLDDGPYGTKQPPANNDKCTPDVILAPMLAFDAGGWRLGYGGGFYDRTVAGLRATGQKVVLIGIAYDEQTLDKIPVGPYDIPLDVVLSPAGLVEPEREVKT
jgi:5-formyltetrahydrofolate cyclo-ligase